MVAKLLIGRGSTWAIATLVAAALASAQTASAGAICEGSQSSAHVDATTTDILERLEAGTANPEEDARRSADDGDFGFVYSGVRGTAAIGVRCHTPYGRGLSVRASALWGDSFDEKKSRAYSRFNDYAAAYNRAIVEHDRFPIADLCVEADPGEPRSPGEGGLSRLGGPARTLERQPLTLHEAARRGGVDETRRFLEAEPVDGPDCFGMTALAWAVAYGREDIALLLLKAGAQSMARGDEGGVTPVLAAISQKHLPLLRLLEPPNPYPRKYVEAAIRSDDLGIAAAVFDAPHDSPVELGAPNLEMAAFVITREGKPAADKYLFTGADRMRIDLARLALQNGADVNFPDYGGDTPLLEALDHYGLELVPMVELLVSAGADVNIRVNPGHGYDTPFWKAYRRADDVRFGGAEVFRRLLQAGADPNVEMKPGIPSVWTVVFPPRGGGDFSEIIAPSPEIMALLVESGLDLNTVYRDQCVLDVVGAVPGADGTVAETLRQMGAKRRAPDGTCSA
ncbi:hypothetical protein sos41_22240 [Alphaproteobacteria bacterium SO-S41]|nr:hypothetical protein sos41_22240 [Alphaproteobacteria bacterium SO-S41]